MSNPFPNILFPPAQGARSPKRVTQNEWIRAIGNLSHMSLSSVSTQPVVYNRCEYCNIHIICDPGVLCPKCQRCICTECAKVDHKHGFLVPKLDYAYVFLTAAAILPCGASTSICRCPAVYPTSPLLPYDWIAGCTVCRYEATVNDIRAFFQNISARVIRPLFGGFLSAHQWKRKNDETTQRMERVYAHVVYVIQVTTRLNLEISHTIYSYTGWELYFMVLRYRIFREFTSFCQLERGIDFDKTYDARTETSVLPDPGTLSSIF